MAESEREGERHRERKRLQTRLDKRLDNSTLPFVMGVALGALNLEWLKNKAEK